MKKSKLKAIVEDILEEKGPTKSFKKAVEAYQKELLKLQTLRDEQKKLANAFVSEKDGDKKAKMKPNLIAHHKKVKAQEEVVNKAEFEYERAMHKEPVDLDEVTINEEVFSRMTDLGD